MFRNFWSLALGVVLAMFPLSAHAGDGATLLLSSGAVIYINNGYSQLVSSVKEFNEKRSDTHIAEINIEGSTFFVNLREVAVVCRDRCSNMEIKQPEKK